MTLFVTGFAMINRKTTSERWNDHPFTSFKFNTDVFTDFDALEKLFSFHVISYSRFLHNFTCRYAYSSAANRKQLSDGVALLSELDGKY